MKKPENALYIVAILHLVGLFGLNSAYKSIFLLLTPLNLLVALGLFLYSATGVNKQTIFGLLLIFLFGFGVEVLGVNTGIPFGKYAYGSVLGPKLWRTPIMIGVNWALLVASVVLIARRIGKNTFAIAFFGGLTMTLLDVLIEPVAIKTGMWHWFGQEPPVQNYAAWFVIAFVFSALFHKMAVRFNNVAALGFFVVQVVFFAVMNLV